MAANTREFAPIRKSKKRFYATDVDSLKPYGKKAPKSSTSTSLSPNAEKVEKIRFENGIEVDRDDCVEPIVQFADSNLQQDILEVLAKRNILSPTPVQMQAIPVLLSGSDLIAIAPTGSGKTFGYLIPLLCFLRSHARKKIPPRKPSSLIMAPTRELMQQILHCCTDLLQALPSASQPILDNQHYVLPSTRSPSFPTLNSNSYGLITRNESYTASHFQNFAMQDPQYQPYLPPYTKAQQSIEMDGPSYCYPESLNSHFSVNQLPDGGSSMHDHYKVTGVCGGLPLRDQIKMLGNGSDIIVGTPGRLIDLCQRNIISLDEVRFIVLDECDKMLEMGLEEQLRKLFAIIMSNDISRQTSLWSATLPDSLERLARSSVVNPITIHVGIKDTISKNIYQNVTFMHTYQKGKKLLQTLRQTKFPPVLIFASSVAAVDEIAEMLKEEEFFAEGLHSQLPQTDRFKILRDFRNGNLDILVATDLASRGLDIPDITHVINYDTPNTIEDYIHRCGRTGRFGRPGQATTFLTLECKIAEDLKFLLESTGVDIPAALKDTKQFGKKVLKTDFGDRVL